MELLLHLLVLATLSKKTIFFIHFTISLITKQPLILKQYLFQDGYILYGTVKVMVVKQTTCLLSVKTVGHSAFRDN